MLVVQLRRPAGGTGNAAAATARDDPSSNVVNTLEKAVAEAAAAEFGQHVLGVIIPDDDDYD
jgi:hypothetical protein